MFYINVSHSLLLVWCGKYGLCHCSSFSRVLISVLIFWACSVSSGCCIVLLYVLFRFRSLVSCKHLCSLSDSIGHHLFRFSRNHDGSIAHNSKLLVHQLLRIPFPSNTDAGSLRILEPSFNVILNLTWPVPEEHLTCKHSTFLYLPNAINCFIIL